MKKHKKDALIIKSIKKPLKKAKRKVKVIKQNGNLQGYIDTLVETVWLLGLLSIIVLLFQYFYN